MRRNRFVNTNPVTRETVKVDLSDDEWVLFKKQLTNGERRHIQMSGFGALKGSLNGKAGETTELVIDWEAMELERVFTWLHGWSFLNANEQPLQFNRENLEGLDVLTFDEIKAKLDEYVGEKEKEKNADTPESTSRLKRVGAGSTSTTSPS